MIKWQHKFSRIVNSEVQNYLSDMGSLGWECLSATPAPQSSTLLFFKRPDPKPDEPTKKPDR